MEKLDIKCIISGKETDGSVAVFEEIVPPGTGPPRHTHRNQLEIFHIIEGRIRFEVNGETFERGAGAAAVIPMGAVHAFRNIGTSNAVIHFEMLPAAEVAFVIAHETAHVIRRHTWDRMIQQSALRAASFAAGRAGVLSGWVRQQGLPMLRSAHAKDFEFVADQDGVGLVRAAGYDPKGAISFLKRIEQLGVDPEVLGEYLASHPAPEERIARLQSRG